MELKNDLHLDKIVNGVFIKIGQHESSWRDYINYIRGTELIEYPHTPFNPLKLCQQIKQECIYPANISGIWNSDRSSFSYCLSLISRINGITTSKTFEFFLNKEIYHHLCKKMMIFIALIKNIKNLFK